MHKLEKKNDAVALIPHMSQASIVEEDPIDCVEGVGRAKRTDVGPSEGSYASGARQGEQVYVGVSLAHKS